MLTVNIHEAKTNLSSLLNKVENENEIILICRNGKPVADVIPHKKSKMKFPLKPHPLLGKMKINYNPTEPLSDEEWPEKSR